MRILQDTVGTVELAPPRESSAPGKPGGKPHWLALDGVRAVAIVSVMVYHLEHRDILPGGYLGVDVFFVLSGFLITSLLVAEREGNDGRVSLRDFYARRVLRLGPALVCAVIAAIALAVVNGGLRGRYTIEMVPWVVVYLGNWAQFFGDSGPGNYLANTWSLAIEEQFYLVWPLLFVLACGRLRSRRTLTLLLFGFAAMTMVYRELITRFTAGGFSRVDLGTTDTHVDGLIVGCGIAFLLARESGIVPRVSRAAGPLMWVGAGTVALLVVFGGYSPTWTMITYPAVVVATALALPGLVAGGPNRLRSALSTRIPVWIGRRSYGLYLYHYVLFNAIWPYWFHGLGDLAKIGLSFIVAAISYRYVELPALRLKRRFETIRPRVAHVAMANPALHQAS
jgi:peptidoglycan/LPS O-acetylase OafA/YrhL